MLILVCLSAFVFVMTGIAWWRREQLPADERFGFDLREFFSKVQGEMFPEEQSQTDKILTLAIVVLIVISILLLGYLIVRPKHGERFTEFWVLGPGGMADNYPTELELGETGTVILGAKSHEWEPVNYKAVVYAVKKKGNLSEIDKSINNNNSKYNQSKLKNATIEVIGYEQNESFVGIDRRIDWDKNTFNLSLEPKEAVGGAFSLEHNQSWGQIVLSREESVKNHTVVGKEVNFKFEEKGHYKLQFLLVRDSRVYRELHLWVNVTEEKS